MYRNAVHLLMHSMLALRFFFLSLSLFASLLVAAAVAAAFCFVRVCVYVFHLIRVSFNAALFRHCFMPLIELQFCSVACLPFFFRFARSFVGHKSLLVFLVVSLLLLFLFYAIFILCLRSSVHLILSSPFFTLYMLFGALVRLVGRFLLFCSFAFDRLLI